MVEKLSSARTMSEASLATSVPAMPMATPDVRQLQCGRVIHPIPRHGSDLRIHPKDQPCRDVLTGVKAGTACSERPSTIGDKRTALAKLSQKASGGGCY